jgi:hypothetical protein
MSVKISDDESCVVEYRIRDHHTARVRELQAPPASYRVHPSTFDGVAHRLQAKIEFGERNPDLTRPEFITLHLSHGVIRIYLGHDVAEGEIKATEFDGTETSSREPR